MFSIDNKNSLNTQLRDSGNSSYVCGDGISLYPVRKHCPPALTLRSDPWPSPKSAPQEEKQESPSSS